MSAILKIFKRKKIKSKDSKKIIERKEMKKIFDLSSPSSVISVTPLISTSSNLTLISSSVNPIPKTTRNLAENKSNNNKILDLEDETESVTDSKNDQNYESETVEPFLSYCLSGYSKQKYTNDAINSLIHSKKIMLENYNNKSGDNEKVNSQPLSQIKAKLTEDHGKLLQKNNKLKIQFKKTQEINEKLKKQVNELESLNQKLLSDNTEVLQEAIKHRFLKLESEDLSKKTNQYKQKLEEKENVIVNFQKQYENLKVKNNLAYKRKEEALLEASHSNIKLKELANDCAQLDIYKCESLQRKFYFNELQNVYGNIRVYLRIKPTIGESCVSFLTDDKVLISDNEKKPKNLICRFTKVFQPHHNNVDVFEEIQALLMTVIDGYNCSFINYGQRGSGKSLTFFGDHSNPGILYRALHYLFTTMTEIKNDEYALLVSAIEVCKEDVNDVFRQKTVRIVDDGFNLILKNTEERLIKNLPQCSQVVNIIHENRTNCLGESQQSLSHLVVIIRVNSVSKVTKEICCGTAMLCDLTGFENENNLCSIDRVLLKEEKALHDTFMDLGKTLITLKSKHKKLPRANTTLTKLLQPCLSNHSKCALFIHSFCDKDQHDAIIKSIQYGLAVMPKQKQKETCKKDIVQWEFSEEEI